MYKTRARTGKMALCKWHLLHTLLCNFDDPSYQVSGISTRTYPVIQTDFQFRQKNTCLPNCNIFQTSFLFQIHLLLIRPDFSANPNSLACLITLVCDMYYFFVVNAVLCICATKNQTNA